MSEALSSLRDYVTGRDSEQFDRLPEGVVSLTISHSNLSARLIELRFDLHQTVEDMKSKIYTHCGTNPSSQKLLLKSGGQVLAALSEDSKMLGYYGIQSGMEVHVVDDDPFSLSRAGGLEDVSLITKYRMTEEDYDKRSGTLRSWIKQQKASDPKWVAPWDKEKGGGGDGSSQQQQAAPSAGEDPPGPESTAHMAVGNRCEVQPGGRRGIVCHLGAVDGLKAGHWVGVKFDEPVGRGTGTVKGKQYFEAEEGYGGFIRPKNVQVGEFPPRDLLNELDSDEEEEI